MKRRQFALAAAALPGLLALPVRAQSNPGYVTLKHPAPVDTPAGQIEVVEFFSYICPFCMRFEPAFEQWIKTQPTDVAVRRVHVGWNMDGAQGEPLQRIYYTLEVMGQVQALQAKVFTAVQTERKRLDKPDVLFAWIAEQGLDRARFEETYKSFGVATKLRRAVQLTDAYGIEGTPALGIAGRFATTSAGPDNMLKVATDLIAQVRKGS